MLRKELHRAVRQSVALRTPAVPSDVGMDVFGVKADSFQNSLDRLDAAAVLDILIIAGIIFALLMALRGTTAMTP